jgi:hypothetical protein
MPVRGLFIEMDLPDTNRSAYWRTRLVNDLGVSS